MKKISIIVFSFMIFIYPFTLQICAQDLETVSQDTLAETDQPVEIKDSQLLRAEFIQKTQNPNSKKAEFQMILNSQINSDRVRVEWTVTGSSIVVNPQQVDILENIEITKSYLKGDLSISKGEQYILPIIIQPTGSGITEIYGVARSVGVDSTVITTVRKNFATNDSREIMPLSDSYKQALNQKRIFDIVKLILLIVLIPTALYFGLKRFIKWLNKEEVK